MVPGSSELDPARTGQASARAADGDLQHPLQMLLPAQPATAALVRQRTRQWLDELKWPQDHREDVVLAVSEAVENVISHAYHPRSAGDVEVYGQLERAPLGMRQAVLTVVDHGRWRPSPLRPTNGGRGFTLMRASMASVRAVLSDHGTGLEMRSQPVPR